MRRRELWEVVGDGRRRRERCEAAGAVRGGGSGARRRERCEAVRGGGRQGEAGVGPRETASNRKRRPRC